MTDPRSHLTQLAASLSLSQLTLQRAEQFFHSYPRSSAATTHLPHSSLFLEYLSRCAILAATRYAEDGEEKPVPLSVGTVLKDLKDVDMHGFMLHLKSFTELAELSDSVRKELTAIKVSFAFSFIFFKKFEELWEKTLPHSTDTLKHFAWIFFLVCKGEILKQRAETIDTAFLLIGALHTIVIRLPSHIAPAIAGKPPITVLEMLSEMMKTQARFSQSFAEKTFKLMQELVRKSVLLANSDCELLSDLFCQEETTLQNIAQLREYYSSFLTENVVDERDFLTELSAVRRARVPITPFAKQVDGVRRLSLQKMLRWDASVESNPVTLQTKMEDVKLTQPSVHMQALSTPMSSAMEMNNWLIGLVETIEHSGITEVLRTYCSQCRPNPEPEIIARMENLKSILESSFTLLSIGSPCESKERRSSPHNQKVDLIVRLYLKMLELMMGNEGRKNAAANFSVILNNDSFHRSLFASCLEAVLFLHNISHLSFEQVLSMTSVSGFEFWKNISTFCSVDLLMPQPLKSHFRMIEIRIITKLGWVKGSPVHQALKFIAGRNRPGITEETTEDEEEEMRGRPLHVTYDLFFKRVLSFAAYRLLTLVEELQIPAGLQEDIWKALKYFLSEKTEVLLDRHLDQLILSAVFGMCKARGHSLKFTQLIDRYEELNKEEKPYVTRNIRLENGEGTIIELYNSVMVSLIKEYTAGERAGENARIESFNPDSSLRNTVGPQFLKNSLQSPCVGKSPFRSPYMTPMTKRLFAGPESPRRLPSDRKIGFEEEELRFEPSKKPCNLQGITGSHKEEISFPVFKKE